jgi:hypothetical protein
VRRKIKVRESVGLNAPSVNVFDLQYLLFEEPVVAPRRQARGVVITLEFKCGRAR